MKFYKITIELSDELEDLMAWKPAGAGRQGVCMSNNKDYEVGYCKPPKQHQFGKGQSGFAGRKHKKKITPTLEDLYRKVLMEEIAIKSGGQTQTISLMEAMIKKTVQSALAGGAADLVRALGKLQDIGALGALEAHLREQNWRDEEAARAAKEERFQKIWDEVAEKLQDESEEPATGEAADSFGGRCAESEISDEKHFDTMPGSIFGAEGCCNENHEDGEDEGDCRDAA